MPAPSGRLRAVTFDCWSTLIHEREPQRSFQLRVSGFTELLREAGTEVIPARAQAALIDAWQQHAASWAEGRQSGAAEVARWALESFDRDDAHLVDRLRALLEGHVGDDTVVALEGAPQTLQTLAERGVRLALICDTGLTPGVRVRELLRDVGLFDRLEALIFSDEVGVPKPNARMFHAALNALGIEAGDAVHVGDLRRTDVAGARAVGMGTIRIRHHNDDQSEHPEADLVAHSHAHLRELLGL